MPSQHVTVPALEEVTTLEIYATSYVSRVDAAFGAAPVFTRLRADRPLGVPSSAPTGGVNGTATPGSSYWTS